MSTEEFAREQAHIDRAYARLDALRERAQAFGDQVLDRRRVATHQDRYERDVSVHRSALRLAALRFGSLPLLFGRIDRDDGAHYHIGRVAVHDEDRDPLVVDWRAPVAEPFYRATPLAPLGLVRRRHFRTRGRRLLGMDDERFGEADGDLTLVGEAALLAAVRSARTGRMTDIVATIQAEQDAVIRAPLEGVLVVQGGPGTGKTAVALHRAAYLLYTHRRRLEHRGVLLIGPTPTFLRYIEDVLPSLGEQHVKLSTVAGLLPWCIPTVADAPEVAELKGDPRMARVLDGVDVRQGPARSLRALLTSAEALERAAKGILAPQEWRTLLRRPWPGWSDGDIALLDELAAGHRPVRRRRGPSLSDEQRWELERLVDEVVAAQPTDEHMRRDLLRRVSDARLVLEDADDDEEHVFGHVLVDEAQDLTPMQWRMLTRRCPSMSMTVVGDLAQATGAWQPRDWRDVTAVLPGGKATLAELTINYRTPEEIMAFAEPLRPPGLTSSRAVRRSGAPPDVRVVSPEQLVTAVADAVVRAADAVEGTIGVVAPAPLLPALRAADERVTATSVADVKGLEFDAVVVVEPGVIVEEAMAGRRGLYIALTRATQRLTIVSSAPLPAELRGEPAN